MSRFPSLVLRRHGVMAVAGGVDSAAVGIHELQVGNGSGVSHRAAVCRSPHGDSSYRNAEKAAPHNLLRGPTVHEFSQCPVAAA